MLYHIFCKETHKYLCTYTNAESLKTLDTTRCYYKEERTLTAYDKLASDTHINKYVSYSDIRKESNSKRSVSSSSQSVNSSLSSNHSYYSQSYSHASSDSCSSDSSSSDSSYSCDSGSY